MFVPGRTELNLQSIRGVVWRPVGDSDVLRQGSVIKKCVRLDENQALFGLTNKRGGGGGGVFAATISAREKKQLLLA